MKQSTPSCRPPANKSNGTCPRPPGDPECEERSRAKWFALAEWTAGILRPTPRQTVTEWAAKNIVLPPPGPSPGPFSLTGREYAREILDSFSDRSLHHATIVSGSQIGKTTVLLVGMAWVVASSPSPILAIFPNDLLAKSLSETRWEPMLRASPELAKLIPTGGQRHKYKVAQQQLGGSTINFVGSNSPANLASRPCRVVIVDETDKAALATDREADAVALAEQRTKSFAHYQIWLTSTPTVASGQIWTSSMEGDLRRYQVPCPHCRKSVILGWNRKYTLLPVCGLEAWMTWDQEARRPNGTWDLDRVHASAHCVCPHCSGWIRTEHKTRMIREGTWVATFPTVTGTRSWHLPSLYANTVQTTFGALAVKFLKAVHDQDGLQGFITGELAEPWEDQASRSERTEIIVRGEDLDKPVGTESVRVLTVDVQAREPFFWYVIREWSKEGNSRLVLCGHCEQWETIRQIQVDYRVEDHRTVVDCGYDFASVCKECLSHGKLVPGPIPTHRGWLPARGREKEAGWVDPRSRQPRLWTIVSAPLDQRTVRLPMLHFNSTAMRDILAKFRKGETPMRWEVTEAADDTYWNSLDSYVRKAVVRGRQAVVEWCPRRQHPSDHLLDCEIMQLPAAMLFGRLPWSYMPRKTAEEIALG